VCLLNPVGELLQLLLRGQLTVDQQVRHLDERRVLRELFDRVTAVAQDSLFTVDVRDRRSRGAGVDETRVVRDVTGLGEQFPKLDTGCALHGANNVQLVLATRQAELYLLAPGLRRSRVGHAHASHGHTGRL
jgi:hypothetical protein